LTVPGILPAVLTNEIIAVGSWHVSALSIDRVNFTDTTPRLALNMLDPSTLMGR
jgi:hypothetical protein